MKQELQEKIFALKPEWFKDLRFGIECDDGWSDLIFELVTKLIALEADEPDTFQGFQFAQIKQKFGGLRVYCDFDSDTNYKRINSLIEAYEHKANFICEICGKDAKVRTLGYVQTLCRYPHDTQEA